MISSAASCPICRHTSSVSPRHRRPGSFDIAAAARGKRLFEGRAGCAGCHAGPLFTDANIRLHLPGDSMAEPEATSYAARSATGLVPYHPLRGALATLRPISMTGLRRRWKRSWRSTTGGRGSG